MSSPNETAAAFAAHFQRSSERADQAADAYNTALATNPSDPRLPALLDVCNRAERARADALAAYTASRTAAAPPAGKSAEV